MPTNRVRPVLSCCRCLSREDTPKYRAILAQYGSLEHYPGRLEMFTVTLETRDGNWLGQAAIERAGNAKRCGSMLVVKGNAMGGRLSHWLGPRPPAAPTKP